MKILGRIINVLFVGLIICIIITMFSGHKTTTQIVDTTNKRDKIVLRDSTERTNRLTGEVEYEDHLYEDVEHEDYLHEEVDYEVVVLFGDRLYEEAEERDERVDVEHTDDGWVFGFNNDN